MPVPVDADLGNPARMWAYWLGAAEYLPVDAQAADHTATALPRVPYFIRSHRAFLRRVVRHLVGLGVRQFLDLGSGIPTAGHVHHTAHAIDPGCRVIYVDSDPVAVEHGHVLLDQQERVAMLRADFRRVEDVLGAAQCQALLDPGQPTAVLLIDSLPYVADADHPQQMLDAYRRALGGGSYVALSHGCLDDELAAGFARFEGLFGIPIPPLALRDAEEIAGLLVGFAVLDPGIVTVPQWRPEAVDRHTHPERFPGLAALARAR
ncbi:SAM-dependent methyltransferase [Gandjariella thermophila]|uniref:SAM-dependent methyltransferase n=1 Tax=Gandjariella thermophila TaxID=1931992 RepID=UPI0010F48E38|nr:SAM-dependent methyltransferase [Gandjariella thermophila]